MDASGLVDILLANDDLTALLAVGPENKPAIYQILSPEQEIFPRLAVLETSREYGMFADDTPLTEVSRYNIVIYARENVLHQINTALHTALRQNGFVRDAQVQDDYIAELDVYVKSTTYSITEML